MKKFLLLAAVAIIGWNTFGRPEGAEYFNPSSFRTNRYVFRANTGYYEHAKSGAISTAWGKSATISHSEMTLIDGSIYRKIQLKHHTAKGSAIKTTYSRLGKDGVYSRKGTDANSPEYLELALPPKVGHRWHYQVGNENMECEIAGIETLEISGKTYEKCLKVKSWGTVNNLPAYILTHYAPNIGIVKLSSIVGGQELEMTLSDE